MEGIDSKEQITDGLTKVGRRESFLVEYISATKEEKQREIRLMEE